MLQAALGHPNTEIPSGSAGSEGYTLIRRVMRVGSIVPYSGTVVGNLARVG